MNAPGHQLIKQMGHGQLDTKILRMPAHPQPHRPITNNALVVVGSRYMPSEVLALWVELSARLLTPSIFSILPPPIKHASMHATNAAGIHSQMDSRYRMEGCGLRQCCQMRSNNNCEEFGANAFLQDLRT